jgi:hypothetical protein
MWSLNMRNRKCSIYTYKVKNREQDEIFTKLRGPLKFGSV